MSIYLWDITLVEGMRWLQGSFGIRFNAFHRERGHVFQARYKSLLVEEGRPLLGLVNYIHLNPVRAGIVPLAQLRDYPWSSFPKFFEELAPESLVRGRFLAAQEFPDTVAGMRRYAESLALAEEHDPGRHDELARKYCHGWAVATAEYRQEIKARYAESEKLEGWSGPEGAELRESKWECALERLLVAAGKTAADARSDRKSAPWKVALARELRAQTTGTNAWIARHLVMGHPTRVCNLIRETCML
ncbi:MAG: hypothetical protein PHC88_15855 [Terrimicrobiaceae bacterium]|nr:hypothetical protein [Terrimicrobiaceae bacterium]